MLFITCVAQGSYNVAYANAVLFISLKHLSQYWRNNNDESKNGNYQLRKGFVLQWAHFPHIHFGLKLDGSKQPKPDQTFAGGDQGTQKSSGFY